MTERIVGPLGIWNFPILNFLLSLRASRFSSQRSEPQMRPLSVLKPVSTAKNLETWQWVDYRGRKREITVHREAEQT